MKWLLWFMLIIIILFALGMIWQLLVRLWYQVIQKKTTIGIELDYGPGTKTYLDAANEIIENDGPVEIDTWLTREDYQKISRAVKVGLKNKFHK